MFGAQPLKADIGIVKCSDCGKPVLKSAITEHAGEYKDLSLFECMVADYGQIIAKSFDWEGKKAQRAKAQM